MIYTNKPYRNDMECAVMMTAEEVVKRQLETYNARDLEGYLAVFSDDIQTFKPPELEPAIDGKAMLSDFYATQRFNRPDLRAELINRMVVGNMVIDHERIFGVNEQPIEMAAVYEVVNGLIRRIWFYS